MSFVNPFPIEKVSQQATYLMRHHKLKSELFPFKKPILYLETVILWQRPSHFVVGFLSFHVLMWYGWKLLVRFPPIATLFFLFSIISICFAIITRMNISIERIINLFPDSPEVALPNSDEVAPLYSFNEICTFLLRAKIFYSELKNLFFRKLNEKPLEMYLRLFAGFLLAGIVFCYIPLFWAIYLTLFISFLAPGFSHHDVGKSVKEQYFPIIRSKISTSVTTLIDRMKEEFDTAENQEQKVEISKPVIADIDQELADWEDMNIQKEPQEFKVSPQISTSIYEQGARRRHDI